MKPISSVLLIAAGAGAGAGASSTADASTNVKSPLTNNTFHCPKPNGSFCLGPSLSMPILFDCVNNIPTLINCIDQIHPGSIADAQTIACWETAPAAGDATCSRNCTVLPVGKEDFPVPGSCRFDRTILRAFQPSFDRTVMGQKVENDPSSAPASFASSKTPSSVTAVSGSSYSRASGVSGSPKWATTVTVTSVVSTRYHTVYRNCGNGTAAASPKSKSSTTTTMAIPSSHPAPVAPVAANTTAPAPPCGAIAPSSSGSLASATPTNPINSPVNASSPVSHLPSNPPLTSAGVQVHTINVEGGSGTASESVPESSTGSDHLLVTWTKSTHATSSWPAASSSASLTHGHTPSNAPNGQETSGSRGKDIGVVGFLAAAICFTIAAWAL